jgi:hypothetical protein
VRGSDAECAFTVVHRGLTAEGGPQEFGLPTFPSRGSSTRPTARWAWPSLHDGLLEYEVVDDGASSRSRCSAPSAISLASEPSLRPAPAGPTIPVTGAQMLGAQRAEYAVLLHAGDWRAADCYAAADAFLVPFERARASGTEHASRPAAGAALRVDGAEVSAVLRDEHGLVVPRVPHCGRGRGR